MDVFRVGYLERPIHPAFRAALEAEPSIELACIPLSLPETAIASALSRCHAYYVGGTRGELPAPWHVTSQFLERCPHLMLVVSQAVGFDTVDVEACTRAGVAVINQAGGNAAAVTEHAFGMILSLFKRIPEANAALRTGSVVRREAFMGREFSGCTLGLVGLGSIGTRMARLAAALHGRVLAYDPYVDEAQARDRGAEKVSFADLLAASDVVSVHCPRSPETIGMFGAAEFAAMRQGAIFISTARGGIHDEAALHHALVSGKLAGAGLDVWDREPPTADHPLLALPCVIASPHTAGVTHESRARVGRMGAEAILAASRGEALPRLVNPSTEEAFRRRWSAHFAASAR